MDEIKPVFSVGQSVMQLTIGGRPCGVIRRVKAIHDAADHNIHRMDRVANKLITPIQQATSHKYELAGDPPKCLVWEEDLIAV